MKNEKIYARNFLIILLALISLNLKSFSQANNYNCCIKNITLVSPNEYQFDVVLEWTGTNSAKFTFLQAGIDFNYSALSNGGTITGAYVPGSGDPSLPPVQNSPNWVINQTSKQIRLLAAIATNSAFAAPIPGPPGFRVGTFRMTNTVPFSSTAPTFTWSFAPGSATKTVTLLGVYLNTSTLSTNVTIPQNHCVLGASACPFASTGGPYYSCGDVVLNGSLLNAVSGTWSTPNGTGTFDPSNTALNATYHPSATDLTKDHINIILTTDPGNTGCTPYVSTSTISFVSGVTVDLGGPYVSCNDYQFHITVSGAPTYTMSTSGTGTFNNLGGSSPIYQSSAADIASGSVTITLTGTGTQNCPPGVATTTITYQPSSAVVVAGGPYFSCGATQMHPSFNFNTIDGFEWSSSGTGTFSPSNTYTLPVYTPSAADLANGSVTITLTAHPAGICTPASSVTTITYASADDDNPCTVDNCNTVTGNITHTDNSPTVNVTPGEISCYSGTTCITVSATGGQTPYSGDGVLCGYGSGDQVITVTDANGCTVNSNVHLNEPDKIVIACSSTPANGTNDGSASVIPGGGMAPYSYQWSNGETGNQINNLLPGAYCVVVSDASGCTASCCTFVGQACNLNAPGPISGPGSACKKQSGVVYCVNASTNYNSYEWLLPAGVIASGSINGNCITVKFTSKFKGGFICVKANTNCGPTANSCTNVILITKKPNTPGTISGPSSLCPGETAVYNITAIPGASGYSWSASGNISIVSQAGASILVQTNNNWNGGDLKVKAVNCKGTSGERTRHLSKTAGCRMSNSQTENIGTKENISEFNVYPNPTTDQLTVSCNSQKAASGYLRISDLTGRIVYIDKIPIVAGQNSKLLSLKDLSEGSYTVTLQLDNGDFKSVQIVRAK
jgi:hypothetical protein